VRPPPTRTWVGLTALMLGALPGSSVGLASPSAPPPQELTAQTARKLEPKTAWRTRTGAWRLHEITITPPRHPFADFDDGAIYTLLRHQPQWLGPASVGSPTAGALLNGKPLPASPFWHVQVERRAWGTPELIACLERSVAAVHEQFPHSPLIHVGDLSEQQGGFLRGHRSHQSGLDADIGFYYRGESAWYVTATEKNLDRERTWWLVRSLITDCSVQYLFMDGLVAALLREYAENVENDQAWVASLFARGSTQPGIIRHAWGHRTHLHLRIFDDAATAVGQRVQQAQAWAKAHPSLAQKAESERKHQ